MDKQPILDNPLEAIASIRKESVDGRVEKEHDKPEKSIFLVRIRRPLVYLLAIAVWLGANYAVSLLLVSPVGSSLFILSPVRLNGPTDLCPGDTLDFEFNVVVKEVGTYNLWMSTWKVDPPPSTIIFSEVQPFVISSEREFIIPRKWKIPVTYRDPGNDKDTPMVPGEYIRDISVTAEGRNTRNKPLKVEFIIRKDCPIVSEVPVEEGVPLERQ